MNYLYSTTDMVLHYYESPVTPINVSDNNGAKVEKEKS